LRPSFVVVVVIIVIVVVVVEGCCCCGIAATTATSAIITKARHAPDSVVYCQPPLITHIEHIDEMKLFINSDDDVDSLWM